MTDQTTQILILVRLGAELTTKSKRVRARFMRRLEANIRDALESSGIGHEIRNEWSRMFVEADSPAALDVLSRVPGISSVSAIEHRCANDLETIVRSGESWFKDRVAGKKFAVRARRHGSHPFRSMDVNVQLGAALDQYGSVDLGNPDVTVHVEVRPDAAYFFSGQVAGLEGLPIGTQDRAVALISGGFDSAVAAWYMLRRGVELDYVLCNLAGAAYERTVLSVVKILADNWSYGSNPRVMVVNFEPVVMALRSDVRRQYVQLVLKRLMYRTGVRIAVELGAQAIVTGEAIGQVSSQTLPNLRCIQEVSPLPVLRPLVAMNKEEIIRCSRKIGTYALSSAVQEYCALVPDRPATAARVEAVRREEDRLDLAMLDPLIAQRSTVEIRSMRSEDLVLPYVHTDQIAPDAVVIDCRPDYQYRAWHYEGAIHLELDHLLSNYKQLERDKTYVLYCPFGLQSVVAAEKMQRAGYEAYSFKGGTKALSRYAQEQGLEEAPW
jgi:thiamine biosynthesis protein ThiI